jgi:hypothetical protein
VYRHAGHGVDVARRIVLEGFVRLDAAYTSGTFKANI